MKSYERLEKYLRGEEVDSYPFEVFSATEALAYSMGYSHEDMEKDEVFDRVIEAAYEKFDTDVMGMGLAQTTVGSALGSKVKVGEYGNVMLENFLLEDYKDLKSLPKKLKEVSNAYEEIIEKGLKIKERNSFLHIKAALNGPLTIASGIRSTENILRDTRKNKEEVKELLEISLEYAIEWMEDFTETFGKTRMHIADPVSSLSLLSVKQYEEFSVSYMKRLISKAYELTGYKALIHICGRSKKMWPYLREMDIGIFSLDNIESMEEAKEALGDKMTIMGNVDPVNIMRYGSKTQVKSELIKIEQTCRDTEKGLILASGCDIVKTTPIENIEEFVRVSKSFGKVKLNK